MAWGSTVPACLAGMVTTFTAHIPNVTVNKGPVLGASSRKEVVLVGWDDVNDVPSVQLDWHDSDAARARMQERYTVSGAVLVTSGSTGLDPFIARAFQILGGIGAALTADKTLGGAVTEAKLASASLDLSQAAAGSVVRIPYSVTVLAFTTA
jgi:hypothetical protein